MGLTVCHAVHDDPELELVAAVDSYAAEASLADLGGPAGTTIDVSNQLEAFAEASAEVVVDFTNIEAARSNLPWLAGEGIHAVVGTTGFDDDDLDRLSALFTQSNCLIAANFAISAVLMMRFAEMAAPWFESAEVIELHHENKIDAPSGTAMATVTRMAEASDDWLPNPTTNEVLGGSRGGEGPEGIRVHSVRLRGVVAHQEVLFGTLGQSLTIRQDSYDRSSFMPGVLLAAKRVRDLTGITLGLESVLDI